MNITDRSHEPAAVFEAWLADVEARPPAWETAEEVERVARAICESDGLRWDDTLIDEMGLREAYRTNARAALSAVHDRDGQR